MFPEFLLQAISYLGSMFGNGYQGCIYLSDMDISSKHMGASTRARFYKPLFALVSLALISVLSGITHLSMSFGRHGAEVFNYNTL